ncbi:MAG: ATP F0F1 synthase subunit B [Synechococcus sp. TMED19]|jgi:F-type H+-transporting ATPase subunit b|nr:MAG: ATP F0F1 synthase subunit B [Synechococcus sp. TMED19]
MTTLITPVLANHGFGLNFNILETNLLNLVPVTVLLVWFLRGFLGGILERRREAVLADLKSAEERLITASAALEVGQKELAQAKSTADKILAEAKQRSILIREDGERRTIEEMARIKQDANANLNAEAARVVESLRTETARVAIDKALAALPKRLNDVKRAELIDRSIEALG